MTTRSPESDRQSVEEAFSAAQRACARQGPSLGEPIDGQPVDLGSGSWVARYQNGSLYRLPNGRIVPVRTAILAAYERLQAEAGPLGLPEGPEEAGPPSPISGRVGRRQAFEKGVIYWLQDPEAGPVEAWPVFGRFAAVYRRLHEAAGRLGYPTGPRRETGPSPRGTHGQVQNFEGGRIYVSPVGSAALFYDQIWDVYQHEQRVFGDFGFPERDPYHAGNWERCDFEGGSILVNPKTHLVKRILR